MCLLGRCCPGSALLARTEKEVVDMGQSTALNRSSYESRAGPLTRKNSLMRACSTVIRVQMHFMRREA